MNQDIKFSGLDDSPEMGRVRSLLACIGVEFSDSRLLASIVAAAQPDGTKPGVSKKSPATEKWSAYFEGAERVSIHDTESEAVGEIECEIDAEHEPGTEIEYLVAPMFSATDMLQKRDPLYYGTDIFESINEWANDEMGAEDDPLDMTPDDLKRLGQLVIDYVCANAKTQWHTVDVKREQKRVYVAGSNEVSASGQEGDPS